MPTYKVSVTRSTTTARQQARKEGQVRKKFSCWNCGKRILAGKSGCDRCGADACEGMTRAERACLREQERENRG